MVTFTDDESRLEHGRQLVEQHLKGREVARRFISEFGNVKLVDATVEQIQRFKDIREEVEAGQ